MVYLLTGHKIVLSGAKPDSLQSMQLKGSHMTLANKARTAAAKLIGYQTKGDGFTKVHHSLTLTNALQWSHCYPKATVTRFGLFVASTTTK
jgi:hypothetical protein